MLESLLFWQGDLNIQKMTRRKMSRKEKIL